MCPLCDERVEKVRAAVEDSRSSSIPVQCTKEWARGRHLQGNAAHHFSDCEVLRNGAVRGEQVRRQEEPEGEAPVLVLGHCEGAGGLRARAGNQADRVRAEGNPFFVWAAGDWVRALKHAQEAQEAGGGRGWRGGREWQGRGRVWRGVAWRTVRIRVRAVVTIECPRPGSTHHHH
eukprot:scaffold324365_cov113-Tisochrysis_lutea.AAC.1